ncbi:family 4 glycosyl hydrolase, partial [Streptococcus pyogenes]
VGLCNVPVMAKKVEAEMLNQPAEDLIYKFAGLNHFHWHKVADRAGNDVTPQVIEKLYEEENGLPKNIHGVPFFREQ